MKRIAVFTSGEEVVTITLQTGKRGFNIHAAHKQEKGKGKPKAQIGCRRSFTDEKAALVAFDELCKETTARGWKMHQRAVRNAFDVIPAPAKKQKKSAA